MNVTAALKEKIDKLSPDKLEQFERYVDFLLEEVRRKSIKDDNTNSNSIKNSNKPNEPAK